MSIESQSYTYVLQSPRAILTDSVDSVQIVPGISRAVGDGNVSDPGFASASFSLNSDSLLQNYRTLIAVDSVSLNSDKSTGFAGEKHVQSLKYSESVHGVLLVSSILFVCALSLGHRLFEQSVREIFNLRNRVGAYVDTSLLGFELKASLFILTVILEGLISYNLVRDCVFMDVLRSNHLTGIFLFGGVFLGIQLVRLLFVALFILLFSEPRLLRTFLSEHFSLVGLWGVVLFPIAVSMVFLPVSSIALLVIVSLLALCWRIVVILKGVKFFLGKNGGLIYIILYLCALEILPLVALFQVLIIIYSKLQ